MRFRLGGSIYISPTSAVFIVNSVITVSVFVNIKIVARDLKFFARQIVLVVVVLLSSSGGVFINHLHFAVGRFKLREQL